jgi:hypothetical protein
MIKIYVSLRQRPFWTFFQILFKDIEFILEEARVLEKMAVNSGIYVFIWLITAKFACFIRDLDSFCGKNAVGG